MPSHKFDLGHAIRLAEPAAVKKIADADRGSFTGYASVFGNADSYGERTAPGAFEASLARWRSDGEMPPLLWSHLPDVPIGRVASLREDDRGLLVSGELNLDTQSGRDAHAHLSAGDVSGMSFGFRVPRGGARAEDDGTVTLTEVDLLEVSLVSMPANRRARITSVKTMQELERALRGEFDLRLPRGAAAKIAPAAWAALNEKPIDLDHVAARIEETIRAVKLMR